MKNIERELLFTRNLKIVLFLSAILLFAVVIMLVSGFKIQPNLKIARDATVKIELKEKDTSVYVNEIKKYTSIKDNEVFESKINIKLNKIKIHKEGFFVWEKSIFPTSNQKVEINPLMIRISQSGVLIKNTDPEYYSLVYKIKNQNKLPTKENPLTLGDTKIWTDQKTLITQIGNEEEFGFFEATRDLGSVSFYKDRSDFIIYSADSGIYIMEIRQDDNNFQNSFPLYNGTNPIFMLEKNLLYILDGQNLLQMSI